MIIRFCFLLLLAGVLFTNSHGQGIVNIIEKDDDTTYYRPRNADINSRLILQLEKDSLFKLLEKKDVAGKLPPDAQNLLETLAKAVMSIGEWKRQLAAAIAKYEKGNRTDYENFLSTQHELAANVLLILDSDPKLLEAFERDSEPGIWSKLARILPARISEVEDDLLNSSAYSDVRLQLGGWLIHNNQTSPLHFEGLDTNPLGEYYEVARWKFAPDEDQLKELAIIEQAVKNGDLKDADFADIIKSGYVSSFTKLYTDTLKAGLDEFKKVADSILQSPAISQYKEEINSAVETVKSFVTSLKQKIEYYTKLKLDRNFTLIAFLSAIKKDIDELMLAKQKTKDLLLKLDSDLASVPATARAAINAFKPVLQKEISIFSKLFIGTNAESEAAADIAKMSLEFSDKVLALSLRDFPARAETDLRYSGFRTPGDRIAIKLIVLKSSDQTRIYQEVTDVRLYQIQPHIEATVGVIFAHPLSSTSLQKDFQMAPYYNLLFKGIFGCSKKWKRRSSLPNTIFDMSFGIHLSSPDFDKDDVPELGVGIVASTLKDYVQFGWAYNIFRSTPYLFFGVRLPLPTMNIGTAANAVTVSQ